MSNSSRIERYALPFVVTKSKAWIAPADKRKIGTLLEEVELVLSDGEVDKMHLDDSSGGGNSDDDDDDDNARKH